MTLRNALLIKRFLHDAGYGEVSVEAMPDRTDRGQNVRAKTATRPRETL